MKHILNVVATPRDGHALLDSLTAMTYGKDELLWEELFSNIPWGVIRTMNRTVGKTQSQLLFGLRLCGASECDLILSAQEKKCERRRN